MGKQFVLSLRPETGEKLTAIKGEKSRTWDMLISELLEAYKRNAKEFAVSTKPEKIDEIEAVGLTSIELKYGDLIKLTYYDKNYEDNYNLVYAIVIKTGEPEIREKQVYNKIKYELVNI